MQLIYILWITLRQARAQVLIFVLLFLLPLSLTVLSSSQKWHSLFPLSAPHHPTHFGDISQHIAEKSCCSGSKSHLAAVIWLQNFPLYNVRFGTSHYFILNLILCDSVWFFFSNGKIKRMTVLKLLLFNTQIWIKRNSILDTNNSFKRRLFVSFEMNVKTWNTGVSQQQYGLPASALIKPPPRRSSINPPKHPFGKDLSITN